MVEREHYLLFDTIYISFSRTDNDSIQITINPPIDQDYGLIRFQENNKSKSILLTPENKTIKVSIGAIDQIFELQIGSPYSSEFQLNTENINTEQSLLVKKSTILNDPDSGGIIIHSRKALTAEEIEHIVWCYIKDGNNCFDPKECYISNVL